MILHPLFCPGPGCSGPDHRLYRLRRTYLVDSFRRAGLLVVLVTAFVIARCGKAAQADRPEEVHLWGRWEETFAAEEEVDLRLTVELTAPNGPTRAVPGFWDGGKIWRVRFMPDEVGTWQYRMQAEPAAPGLDGQKGQFTVRSAEEAVTDSSSRFLTHGPVHVAENGRYLKHEDGTPFFWLMDTAWNGALKSTSKGWGTYG